MELQAGYFIAVNGDDFIARGIKKFESIRLNRVGKPNNNLKYYNHIAGLIMPVASVTKDRFPLNQLLVGEAEEDGFNIKPWKGTRYDLKKVDFDIFKFWRPYRKDEKVDELFALTLSILAIEHTPYDFEGIIDSADFDMTGHWKGDIGIDAQKRLFCSEAWATKLNDIVKGCFPHPWCVDPMAFVMSTFIHFHCASRDIKKNYYD